MAETLIERGTVHFTVEGQFLTDISRQLWADEHQPEKALNILRSAFPTMQPVDILAILTGSKKLAGDSDAGIDLLDDNATRSECGSPLSIDQLFRHFRNRIEEGEDCKQLLVGSTFVTASPQGLVEIPVRRKEDWLAGKIGLDDMMYRGLNGGEALESRAAERERTVVLDLPEEPPPPKPQYIRFIPTTWLDGWLDPEGRFYRCGWMEHISLAHRLGLDQRQMELTGWIKLSGGEFFMDLPDRLTQTQRDLIWDWCRANNKKMPWWLEED